MKTITTFMLILLMVAQGLAQKTPGKGDADQISSLGSSAIRDLPKKSDTNFVLDEQAGSLDTGCTYRGSLHINFSINRVLGPTNETGRLPVDRINTLISKGYLSPYALLRMPMWDVDRAGGEINRVSFNGYELDHPTEGSDGTWVMNEFKVPMQQINFGRLNSNGGPALGSVNTVRIDIDTTGAGWCTSVDWIALSFKAVSPVVMIHGNGSDGEFWGHDRQGFKDAFDDEFLISDNTLSFSPSSNTRQANATQLQAYLIRMLPKYGVDSLHIVAHSKGGLDTRQFLADAYVPLIKSFPNFGDWFRILSFTTLSTPHNGSVGADLTTTYTAAAKYREIEYENIPQFAQLLTWLNSFGGPNAGHPDLRTGTAALFNAENVPALRGSQIQFGTVVADADRNGSGTINSRAEYLALTKEDTVLWGLDITFQYGLAMSSVDSVYQLIGSKRTIRLGSRVVPSPNPLEPPKIVAVIQGIEQRPFEGNDTLVTLYSGRGFPRYSSLVNGNYSRTLQGANGRNHADVADKGVGQIVLPWVLDAERRNGDLK